MRSARSAQRKRREDEPWRRLRAGMAAVLLVIICGSIGYRILGLPWFDAIYQTVVVVTTVGFSEIGIEDVDSVLTYRVFSLALIVVGVASVLYTLGLAADNLIEGSLNHELQRRRMVRSIDRISNHTIVAGWGQVGRSVAESVSRAGGQVVLIDRDGSIEDDDHLLVVGEATDDDTLIDAGIERASSLVLALDHDADNLFVCVSARALRPDLMIAARVNDDKNEAKLRLAGANHVANPHEIGGSRLAALATQPHVADFLDEVLANDEAGVTVQQFELRSDAPDQTVGSLFKEGERTLILALRRPDGSHTVNPLATATFSAGDIVIALGTRPELQALRGRVS
jgi:voltage-gated potassium channel